jgi:hypothetical protein
VNAPLSEQQLAEIAARVEAAEGGWHVVPDEAEPYRFEIHGDGPTIVAVFGGDSYPVRENAEFAAHARQDVPALLADNEWLRKYSAEQHQGLKDLAELVRSWHQKATAAEARVAELEAERHTTNEAPSEAAEALRDANTTAGLVAEYHVPAANGRWLAVRREPNGDRWAIYTAGGVLGDRKTWTGELWISIALATDSELWNYTSADAALAEATRLAENTPAAAS